jgi:hypothetical protein
VSAFYVGQRVRVVRVYTPTTARVGWEGVVNELGCFDKRDRPAIGVTINGDPDWCFPADFLEPIVDDGRKVVSWSDCLWQPEGVAA